MSKELTPVFRLLKQFNYRGYERKRIKRIFKLSGLVDDHHIIPKQLKNHKLILYMNFNINHRRNLIVMPNLMGEEHSKNGKLQLTPDRLIHHSGHMMYNNYVRQNLNTLQERIVPIKCLSCPKLKYNKRFFSHCECDSSYNSLKYPDFEEFMSYLRKNLRVNKDNIPWN